MNKKIFSNLKILFAVVAVIIASTAYVIFFQVGEAESFGNDGIPKAAIIDQLYDEMTNEPFQKEAIEYFENAGYQVDVFNTQNVTIDLFKNLPKMNYKFVVVRTHGVADFDNENAMLFTGEKYSQEKYTSEQLLGQVKRATPVYELSFKPTGNSSNWIQINETTSMLISPVKIEDKTRNEYFVITPKFVDEVMEGKFHDTIFLLGGCSTLSNPSMSQALIARGASAVAGWDDQISGAENDYTLLKLLENMLKNDLELGKAIDDTRSFFYGNANNPPVHFIYYTQENN